MSNDFPVMKKYFLLLFALLSVCPVFAQGYLVYTVKGDVTSKIGVQVAKLSPGDELSGNAVVTIPASGRLVIVNPEKSELYTLKEGIGALSSLLAAEDCRPQAVTAGYLAFIKEKARSGNKAKDVDYMQTAGTSYRGVGGLFDPLPEAPEGMLLQPLRDCWSAAVAALAGNQAEALAAVADSLDRLGVVRRAFVVSDYTPQSFNGYFVFDALCLRDLSYCLDPSVPFSEQIGNLPVPLSRTTDDQMTVGNILCDHYVLAPGQHLVLQLDCIGYCEIATFSLTEGIITTFDGDPIHYRTFPEETEARVEIVNPTASSVVVTFAVNY